MGSETVRLWLVERTYSADEQNLIILVYATTDGRQYVRKERALTSFTGAERETTAAIEEHPDTLGTVEPGDRQRYAAEASRMASEHNPDGSV